MNGDEVRQGVALAFARLDKVGSGRVKQLLALDDPLHGWIGITRGRSVLARVSPELSARWSVAVAELGLDPERELDRHREAGVGVATWGDPGYPPALLDDRSAPGLLLWRGDVALLGGVSVAVVGTRRCTAYGRDVAKELGAGLAAAGISVVSGLALGIDGAAHHGSLSVDGAPPIGVVGSGPDRIYPRRHASIWQEVCDRGVLLTEAPLGVRPDAWRFPSRNRVIAALGRVTVVVESGPTGGSMHTVREADDRGRTVMAVPGSVRSHASVGTNQLLAEGCPPCRDLDDVLVALGLVASRASPATSARPSMSADAEAVAEALHAGPATLEELLLRTGHGLDVLAVALEEAVGAGAIESSGGWYERVDR